MNTLLPALAASLIGASAVARAACMTDTTQSDFQSGVARNVDVNISPGNAVLTKSFAVDQQNAITSIFGTPFNTTAWVGQSFTPALSGRLTRVDVNLFCSFCSGTPPSILVGVRATSGGLPTGPDLATATIPPIAISGQAFYSAIFATPATLTAGTQYALVLRPSTNPVSGKIGLTRAGTNSAGDDVYAGGALLNSANGGSTWTVQAFSSSDPTKTTGDASFMTYIHGGYASSGNFTGATRDSNPPAGAMTMWSSLAWTASVPGGSTLSFQVAASDADNGPFNFVGPDGTGATFFDASGVALSAFNGKRYLQYRAYLGSSVGTATPTLADATVCFDASAAADLSIAVSDGVVHATPGGDVTYSIVATNTGPAAVTGAAVVDAFPAALTCTWSCAITGSGSCSVAGWGNIDDIVNLGSGSSATYTAQCWVSTAATSAVVNTATIAPPGGVMDPDLSLNAATDTDALDITTNVVMSMDDGVDFVRIGDVLDYLIELSNENGPSDAVVSVQDVLPAQLASGSWICIGSGTATCNDGSGNTLADTATVPAGGKVDYLYSATLVGETAAGQVGNAAAAFLQFGTNQPSSIISAAHTDTVVVFRSTFEAPPAASAPFSVVPDGADQTVELGIDAGLLAHLAFQPQTIATARADDGRALFALQFVRRGAQVALRALWFGNEHERSATPWRRVDLGAHRLSLSWRRASNGAHDGVLVLGAGNARVEFGGHGVDAAAARLEITMSDGIPWLAVIAD